MHHHIHEPVLKVYKAAMKDIGFENISVGCAAWQSSLSKRSRKNDAERALRSKDSWDFAFHTKREENPWWVVDFANVFPIFDIVIENRRRTHRARARTLTIELSRDGRIWQEVHACSSFDTAELVIDLKGEVVARYMRISLRERQYLHLARVEVWTRRSLVKMVANRYDGLGQRLLAVLNAAYLSRIFNCDLRVVWPERVLGFATTFSNDVEIDGNLVLGHSIGSASDIFAPFFTQRHVRPGLKRVTSNISALKDASRNMILDRENYDDFGMIFAPSSDLKQILNSQLAPNHEFGLRDIFFEIPFSRVVSAAIDAALSIEISKPVAALHLRSGDIVYGSFRLHGSRFIRKAVPLPLAKLAIIYLQKRGFEVIIFGEDSGALEAIAKDYDVRIASDFLPSDTSGTARAMFDIVLMSRAQTIWSGDSGFAQISHAISEGAEFEIIHDIMPEEEQIAFFVRDLEQNKGKYHPRQEAFALWYLACISEKMPAEFRIGLLDRAFYLDEENPVFLIAKASICYAAGKDDLANSALEEALIKDWCPGKKWGGTTARDVLCRIFEGKFHLGDLMPPVLAACDRNQPVAMLAAAMIAEAQGEPETRDQILARAASLCPENAIFRSLVPGPPEA